MQAELDRDERAATIAGATGAMLVSSRRSTMTMQIYRALRRRIIAGEYSPLQSLSESVIAESLGASRTPVREAFGKLEEEGLVTIRPQYGTFVAPIAIDRIEGDQFVREALECAAVREAARRCTPQDATALNAILKGQRACKDDASFFESDESLHRALMALAGQKQVWAVVDAAKVNLDRIRRLCVHYVFKRRSIVKEHEQIVAGVVARDPDAAAAAMRDHLRGVFASSREMMQAHPEQFQAPPTPLREKRLASGASVRRGPAP